MILKQLDPSPSRATGLIVNYLADCRILGRLQLNLSHEILGLVRETITGVPREKTLEAEWRTKHGVESEIQPSLHRCKASALCPLELTKLLFYRSLGSTSPAQHPLSYSLRHLTITVSTEELLMESCWLLCNWENG